MGRCSDSASFLLADVAVGASVTLYYGCKTNETKTQDEYFGVFAKQRCLFITQAKSHGAEEYEEGGEQDTSLRGAGH